MNKIKLIFKSLNTEGSFIRDVSTISLGKVMVICISLIFVPILSRLYEPESYGNFSLFSSIVTLSSILVGLGYPSSFPVIREKKEFNNLLCFLLILLSAISILCFLAVEIVRSFFIIDSLFRLLPAGIFIGGLIIFFSNWNIRRGAFKLSAFLESSGNLIIRLCNLAIGFFFGSPTNGLIFGDLLGKLYATCINIWSFLRSDFRDCKNDCSRSGMLQAIKNYDRYPKFILPNQFIGIVANHLPIYILTVFSSTAILGYFGMAVSLLNIPTQLVANGVSTVFYKKAVSLKNESSNLLSIFSENLIKKIFLAMIVPFSTLVCFGSELLTFFLGKKWIDSGEFVSLMASYFILYIVIAPTLPVYQVLKKESLLLKLSILQIVISGISLIFGFLYFETSIMVIGCFSLGSIVFLLIQGYFTCRILDISFLRTILMYYVVFIGTTGVILFLKISFF